MKRMTALVMCVLLASPGCSAVTRLHAQRVPERPRDAAQVDPALMADYIRQLPVGSRVKITRFDGSDLRATLMRRDSDPIVVQRHARLPEPPLEIPVRDITTLELDKGESAGRTIAIGVAAGAGAALGVLLLLAAIFSD
ncbi:MAG: hypothetical protein ACRD15_03820 [Vicinamibacterales bacterium]